MRYGDKITTGTFNRFRETLYQQHGIHIPTELKPRDIQHLRDTAEFYWLVYNVISDMERGLEVDTSDLKTVAAVLGTLWQVLQEK
ncbi:hypothetical protein [Shewanella sp. SE1]|uniref:hypothetical protein n=1 Tax=Shewanella sp. SE1 TaxID=2705014 RepID=UPI00138F0833|nr:hypothetical protein [Shewanella sp. SE1]NDO73055.1 hypothetical protein [Shewanella sp. SE1]